MKSNNQTIKQSNNQTIKQFFSLTDCFLTRRLLSFFLFGIFMLLSCHKDAGVKIISINDNVLEERTEVVSEPSCGNFNLQGCRFVRITKIFPYEGCEFKIDGFAWICPDKIILESAYEIASTNPISEPCLEIIKTYNLLGKQPFIGKQLVHEYFVQIHANLQNQLRSHIVNNVLEPQETLNFRCNASNPCNSPVSKSFKSLRVDCWSFCEDSTIPDPDDPVNNPPLVLLRRAKCGYGGCCIETRPFCIDNDGSIGYGTTSNSVVQECEQNNSNMIDPCTIGTNFCPEVCNQ